MNAQEPAGIDTAKLAAWLHHEHPQLVNGPLTATPITGGMSNLTYAMEGARESWILRRPPLGHVLATAHDMAREARVITALHGTQVPVPEVVLSRDDADGSAGIGVPFYIMRRVEGVILKTKADNNGYSATALHRLGLDLAETLADLHSVDATDVGLGDFGRPAGYLERQVARWSRQLASSASRPLPELDRLAGMLAQSVPESGPPSIIHGDFRLDNCIVAVDSLRIAAVLDWEMATLGDPLADFALFGLYWVMPDLDPVIRRVHASSVDSAAGYPTLVELVDTYSARMGIPTPDLSWYLAFSAFKVAVISESIHYRYVTGHTIGGHFGEMGDMTTPLAVAGLDFLAKG